jgi:hypothetical protein
MGGRIKQTNKSAAPNKQFQQNELIKCGTDAKYFINKYIKIPHPTKGLLPFKTFPYQDQCLDAFEDHRFIIVNKSRQLGLSTVSAAYSLWLAIFRREKNILVIATRLDTAKLFLKKVRTMYDHLPKWLVMPKVTAESVKYLEFSNGSKIKAEPTSESAGRGEALSMLVVDEAAHIDGIEDLYLSLRPTLSTGGGIILISSPSGVGTLFHKIWVGANQSKNDKGEGDNGYFPIELPWTVHPERDKDWYERERKDIIQAKGERGVAQELLCAFNSSGDTLLNGDVMDGIFSAIKPPEHKVYIGRDEVWVWKQPEPGHKYIIGADVARGDGDDCSTFTIINTNTDEVVADFQGKPMPDKFAGILVDWARTYNDAFICSELNNVGVVTALKLKESGYTNIYYERHVKNMFQGYATHNIEDDELPGFTVDVNTRVEILMKLTNALQNNKLKIYSDRMFKELQTFIWKGNKPQAQKGYHDDLVMGLAIANNLYEATGKSSAFSGNDAMNMAAAFSRNTQQLNPITGRYSGEADGQTRTSDGFWELPNGGGNTNMRHPTEQSRQMSTRYSNSHNYNHPQWHPFKWVFNDD